MLFIFMGAEPPKDIKPTTSHFSGRLCKVEEEDPITTALFEENLTLMQEEYAEEYALSNIMQQYREQPTSRRGFTSEKFDRQAFKDRLGKFTKYLAVLIDKPDPELIQATVLSLFGKTDPITTALFEENLTLMQEHYAEEMLAPSIDEDKSKLWAEEFQQSLDGITDMMDIAKVEEVIGLAKRYPHHIFKELWHKICEKYENKKWGFFYDSFSQYLVKYAQINVPKITTKPNIRRFLENIFSDLRFNDRQKIMGNLRKNTPSYNPRFLAELQEMANFYQEIAHLRGRMLRTFYPDAVKKLAIETVKKINEAVQKGIIAPNTINMDGFLQFVKKHLEKHNVNTNEISATLREIHALSSK